MRLAEIVIQLGDEGFLESDGSRAGFVLLLAFLASFGFIRLSARLMRSPKVPWWPGSIKTDGGLHVHHLVFGIILLLLAGFVAIAFQPESPWLEVSAAAFGIGAGLTLDEFALWLHLEDVYWSEEGRRSIDAVVMATLIGGLLLLGFVPLAGEGEESLGGLFLTGLTVLALSAVTLLKGKIFFGIAGLLVPFFSFVGALRLAKPGSPWARWRYRDGSRRLARAEARYARLQARYQRWQDRIGGRPDKPSPAAVAATPPQDAAVSASDAPPPEPGARKP
jgi:hypothetical protein